MSTKNGTNGKAPEAGTAVQEPKPETSPVTVNQNGTLNGHEQAPKPTLTVEEKIQKVNSLIELIEKRDLIKSHLSRVETMKFDEFDEKHIITITSQHGNASYPIKSGYLCEKIAKMLKDEFSQKIKEVEALIAF